MCRIRRVSVLLWMLSTTFAQPSERLVFEVATIKPSAAKVGGGRTSTSGNTITYNNTSLLNALARAFELKSPNQVVGPGWVFENRYDIVAKAPENAPKEQFPLMLQNLLIINGGAIIDHEAPHERLFVAVEK